MAALQGRPASNATTGQAIASEMVDMCPTAAFISFRLGGTDGVAIEAGKWAQALAALGFETRRIAGEIAENPAPGDVVIPGLAIGAEAAPDPDGLVAAIANADLLIVENLLSLPLNLPAARALTDALTTWGGRVLLHHHDLAWQRDHLRHIAELPPRLPGAVHVTINNLSRSELAQREVTAHTIRNCFDLDAPTGDRPATRARLGVAADDIVVLQPTRAIERKGVPRALGLTHSLSDLLPDRTVRYWLAGEIEEGYGPVLDDLLGGARVPVLRDRSPRMADMYAACDLVAFPSTWEGFGNPIIESVWARRPLVVGHYPVLDELLAYGFRFLDVDDPGGVAEWLRDPDPTVYDENLAIARKHFSLEALVDQLHCVFQKVGWTDW